MSDTGLTSLLYLYRRRAPRYDITSHAYGLLGYRLDAYRRRGIELLALHPGDTVVEIGCGTGANFARLERAIGPTGAIIGVDLSPAMLEQARSRVRREGWANVTLVESGAARYGFPGSVNAILSTYALTLEPSYDDLIRQGANALVPGGRFVVVDFKAPPSWARARASRHRPAVPSVRRHARPPRAASVGVAGEAPEPGGHGGAMARNHLHRCG